MRWLEAVEKDLRETEANGWQKRTVDREEWAL